MRNDRNESSTHENMSSLFKGLQFFLLPNNRSGVTEIRKRIARENSAIVNGKLNPEKTTHILVDLKSIPYADQAAKRLEKEGVKNLNKLNIPILSQSWLTESAQSSSLLPYDEYAIKIRSHSRKNEVIPQPKKQKVTKIEALNQSLDEEVISKGNPNATTINLLQRMCDERKAQGDYFKVKAYRIAIDSLSKSKKYIDNSYDAIQLPGIGKSIAEKIEEITKTHTLKELDILEKDQDVKLMKLFKGIYGVGDVCARKWIHEDMKTLKQISDRDDLNINQRLGLEYYDVWNLKIPRKECKAHDDFMTSLVKDIDPKVELTIGGSYRRGASTTGDIDFIMTKPNSEIDELHGILSKILKRMKDVKYHKCSLSLEVSTRWMGGCSLPPDYNKIATGVEEWGKCRRVDFLLVPWEQRGAAFIYFTGNDVLNKRLRLIAKKKNMNLNGSGLFKKHIDKDGKEKQELLEGFDEKKIFEILGVKWREPTKRNIGSFEPL